MLEFMHIGVPTTTVKENEVYVSDLKVYVTNPEEHQLKFEYLRFDQDTPLPEIMREKPHIAFKVDSIDEYIQDAKIIVEPFAVDEKTRITFIVKDDVVFELMEVK